MTVKAGRWFALVALAAGLMTGGARAQSGRSLEGMWSDPPNTLEDRFCGGWCTDAGLERLFALLDDPKNDARPYAELAAEARTQGIERYIRPRLTGTAAKEYPLDPATDPGFARCEPWGLARQVFAPHQLQITRRGDRIELRYGEWDARRTVYLDGRAPSAGAAASRLGHSVGHFEGETLVVESTGIAANRAPYQASHSSQLRVVERYRREGDRLVLTATLEDPATLKEPIVLKRVWRWAPDSEIAPYTGCERPTEFRTREKQP